MPAWGRMGAPMIPAHKRRLACNHPRAAGDYRTTPVKLLVEMSKHSMTKRKLEIATRKVEELVIEEEFKKELASIESEPESEPEEFGRNEAALVGGLSTPPFADCLVEQQACPPPHHHLP
jgi:hypothetical protein